MITILPEAPNHLPGVRLVNELAFGRPDEADLVDVLREEARPFLSLVAVDEGERVVGHILFTPVTIEGAADGRLELGLGPMAVLPAHQKQGIGSRLVAAGLDECRRVGAGLVVVLGHPEFYPRFGFLPASRLGLRCAWPVPDEVFMALELQPSAPGAAGLVSYHPAFDRV
jgi:putative acetyltransferase